MMSVNGKFLLSAFAFEQFKLPVKQRLIRFERQSRLETAAIPASSRKVESCSKQRAICPIEEDLSRSTNGIKSIITSDLRATEAIFRNSFCRELWRSSCGHIKGARDQQNLGGMINVRRHI